MQIKFPLLIGFLFSILSAAILLLQLVDPANWKLGHNEVLVYSAVLIVNAAMSAPVYAYPESIPKQSPYDLPVLFIIFSAAFAYLFGLANIYLLIPVFSMHYALKDKVSKGAYGNPISSHMREFFPILSMMVLGTLMFVLLCVTQGFMHNYLLSFMGVNFVPLLMLIYYLGFCVQGLLELRSNAKSCLDLDSIIDEKPRLGSE